MALPRINWVTFRAEMLFFGMGVPMAAIGPVSEAMAAWREERADQLAMVLRRSQVGVPFGERIHNLRTVLGWSQREAARQLGVCVRSVIRHELAQSLRPWLPLLQKVRGLEAENAEILLAYLVHAEKRDPSLGSSAGPYQPPG